LEIASPQNAGVFFNAQNKLQIYSTASIHPDLQELDQLSFPKTDQRSPKMDGVYYPP
jgi:hypothetical protein